MNVEELIKEAKQGSAAAQKCLFDLFANKMLLVCHRYVKNREDAEEIMLDGFYKFFKTIASFQYQNEAMLFGWIKKIMINECLMYLRKHTVFNLVSDAAADELPVAEDALDKLSASEIFTMILQLPTGYRTVFNLHAVEGLPHNEIATLLGIAEGTSKSQLSKAKLLLQKMLMQNKNEYATRKTR